MKRKSIFLLLAAAFSICQANAQTMTIINETTDCDLIIYSGDINVSGVDYYWGSEDPGVSISYRNTTATFTPQQGFSLSSPTPPVPPIYTQTIFSGTIANPVYIPYIIGATKYIGFKFRLSDGSGAGYISALNPYIISSPASCLNPNLTQSYTVVWTGTADNPTVYILP